MAGQSTVNAMIWETDILDEYPSADMFINTLVNCNIGGSFSLSVSHET